ncbi:MAG: GNAT family N-acetyltransferase [Acidimicrobiales bacterium]
MSELHDLRFTPVTRERLDDLKRFCGIRGRHGHGGFAWCGCMRWRMPSSAFRTATPEQRRQALYGLVRHDIPVGILAYSDDEPVAWCSIAPRGTYEAMERSRTLQRVDDLPVWSVACFFIDGRFRAKGVTARLLGAAVAYAGQQGAVAVEGYPANPNTSGYNYMGWPAAFAAAGFKDVTPSGAPRQVLRKMLRSPSMPAR